MVAMTLRLDDQLAKKLDRVCKERGYKKSGFIQSLIRNFLNERLTVRRKLKKFGDIRNLDPLIGIMSIGGDSVKDSENYYD